MLSVIPLHQGLMAVVWLAIILLLILGASRAVRLLPPRLLPPTPQVASQMQENSLLLRGSMALDLGRRVYLVEAAGQSTLILTGGTADLMLVLKQADG